MCFWHHHGPLIVTEDQVVRLALREVPLRLTQESIFIYLRPVGLIGFAQYWILHMIETVSGFRLASVLFGNVMTWKAPPSHKRNLL
jgi:hypothetical protein